MSNLAFLFLDKIEKSRTARFGMNTSVLGQLLVFLSDVAVLLSSILLMQMCTLLKYWAKLNNDNADVCCIEDEIDTMTTATT